MTSPCSRIVCGALFTASLLASPGATGDDRPRAFAVDDGTRLRREDVGTPLSRGEGNPLWRPGAPIRLGALRGEVIALQIVIEAGAEPARGVEVELPALIRAGGGDARSAGAAPTLAIERFVEHYVEIKARSRNARTDGESLGWAIGARPPDDKHLGALPDALIPVDLAPAWAPYPLQVPARLTGAVWIDIAVPASAAAGVYEGTIAVRSASHGEIAALDLRLDVAPIELPYRPVSFLAYYEPDTIEERVGGGPAVEQQLWQLLHAHVVDGFASLQQPADAERLRAAVDGSLFTPERGYRGPGEGVAPAAVALGAYGQLGDPSPDTLRLAEELTDLVPPAVEDVMLYAIDEQCQSPRGPGWRRLVHGSRVASRLLVGHTCGEVDPALQDVDLVITPANHFNSAWTKAARDAGKRLWVYNGALPHAGTFMIDSPLTGFMANGWIAASYPVGRWFLWETGFWHDGNRGGKGPIDPFTVAENFHNRDGDACLGDGMLLYPGTQRGQFAARSIGYPGVLPSMRLKSLRRGIQDAGYIALARAAAPKDADAIVKAVIPAALDDVPQGAAAPWSGDGAPFFEARAALRALIPAGASLDRAGVRRVLADAAAARGARDQASRGVPGWVLRAVAALVVAGAAFVVVRYRRRAARNDAPPRPPP